MLEKRQTIDRCVADLQIAQSIFNSLACVQGASEEQVHKAAIHAKKLEVKLAAMKLAQAEYHLDALSARIDFLSLRCAQPGGATQREEEELAWAREAKPINTAVITRLAADLEQRKRELDALIHQAEPADTDRQ